MKKQQLDLPEWAFLEATSHLGNLLKDRDILQHIRSYTMLEVFAIDELKLQLNPDVKTRKFSYKNRFGIEENHIFVIHFSLAEFAELEDILDKAVKFYCNYLDWEDKTIVDESTSKHN